MSSEALVSAFTAMMQKMTIKAEVVQEKKIVKDRFTVAQKMSQIKDVILIKDKFLFTELFESDYSKGEAINTFLAVLELLKLGQIRAVQTENFADILITKREENDE